MLAVLVTWTFMILFDGETFHKYDPRVTTIQKCLDVAADETQWYADTSEGFADQLKGDKPLIIGCYDRSIDKLVSKMNKSLSKAAPSNGWRLIVLYENQHSSTKIRPEFENVAFCQAELLYKAKWDWADTKGKNPLFVACVNDNEAVLDAVHKLWVDTLPLTQNK